MSKRAKATLNISLRNNDALQVSLQRADGSCHVEHDVTWSSVLALLREVMPVSERRWQRKGSNIEERPSRSKVPDLVSESALDAFARRESEIGNAVNRPLGVGQIDMLSQNRLSALIVYGNRINGSLETRGTPDIRNWHNGLVHQECSCRGYDSLSRAQVCCHRCACYRTGIVCDYFHR